MSAKHALLGLLLDRPGYAYGLANSLQERLGPAWKINSGQVSQVIRSMAADGLIEPVGGGARVGSDRRQIVAITAKGAGEFERWLGEITGGVRLSRRPLLAKVTLAGRQHLDGALEQIDAWERDCVTELNSLLRIQEENQDCPSQVRADHVLRRLNLSAAVVQLEGELNVARQVRDTVRWLLDQDDAVWPATLNRSNATVEQARQKARTELFGRMAAGEGHQRRDPPN
jgi:DNA-binding PadR family transcriptional regulator